MIREGVALIDRKQKAKELPSLTHPVNELWGEVAYHPHSEAGRGERGQRKEEEDGDRLDAKEREEEEEEEEKGGRRGRRIRPSFFQLVQRLLPVPPHFPEAYMASIYGYTVPVERRKPHYELEKEALAQRALSEGKEEEEERMVELQSQGLAHRKNKKEEEYAEDGII